MDEKAPIEAGGHWQGDTLAWRPVTNQVRGVLLGIFVLLIGAAWWSYREGWLRPELLMDLANRHVVAAIVLFVLVYAACMMALLPTLPLNLAAGMLWGGLAGAFVASAGGGLGAVLAFLLARRLLGRPLARKVDHRFLAWLQREFEAGGWRFVAFVRLNPVFPTGPINYVFGLSVIPTFSYIWSTLAFLFPPTLAFAILGDEMGSFLVEGRIADLVRTALIVSGAITLLVFTRICIRYFRPRNDHEDRAGHEI